MTNHNMTNREVCDLIFVDYATKKPFLNLDFANVTTTELTGESVFAYGGKGHPKCVRFSGDRGGTLTVETQIQTVQLWQLITGGELSGSASFIVRKEIAAGEDGASVALDDAPVPGTITVYAAGDDCGTELACTVADREITLSAPLSAGAGVIVYYMKEVTEGVQRINVKSTSFPKNFIVYGDTVMKTEDDQVLPYKLTCYKAAPQGSLSLSYSNNGDPGSITITCDLLADSDGNILDLTLLGE
ncbi:MAG: hypothetical protein HFH83_07860 [Lachnospiraceae bacterium]|jgi:hypothetical protein|nr:hypothetical protein [Lachnospiraceae bacterium]